MKKITLLCIFVFISTVLFSGGVFAQSNWISGEIGLFGAGLRYERMLTSQWSFGANIFYNSFFFLWNSVGAEAFGRFYPWSGNFYAEVGMGFGTVSGIVEYEFTTDRYGRKEKNSYYSTTSGLIVSPGVGWRIDVGNPGSFFINPSIIMPIVFGKSNTDSYYEYGSYNQKTIGGEFDIGINFKAAFGMGYAF